MKDQLIKFMAHVDMVSIICIETTELVEKARTIHKLNPTPTAALGRTLTMAAMMGATLKNEKDRLTIQINGDGPLGSIVVAANSKSQVKGYVMNPFAEMDLNQEGKLNVGGIVGKGYLNVIKDIGLKEPYIGNVPVQTGEIAEDFTYYYAMSEQIPTAIALGVLVNPDGSVKKAGGYMLQVLPDTPEEIIRITEKRLKVVKPVTTMLEENKTLEEIATFISDDLNTRMVQEAIVPEFQCDCSKERMEKALISLGEKQILELAEQETTELQCYFCNQKYNFLREELKEILKKSKK